MIMIKKEKIIKTMGSNCKYCYLDEGVYSVVYFCKNKNKIKDEFRLICTDGFRGECEFFDESKV